MCGRFTLTADAEALREELGLEVPEGYEPRYNIAPQQPVLVIAPSKEGGRPRTGDLLWGLVPWWTEGKPGSKRIINVRAETLGRKFRHHFERRRCLIPADGFYEWRKDADGKTPMRVTRADRRLFAFAGVWDRWDAEGEEPLYTCAIVTTRAAPEIAPIHDRMPLILDAEGRAVWLDRDASPEDVGQWLRPYGGALDAFAVSRRVNSVRNDDPACIEPVNPGGEA